MSSLDPSAPLSSPVFETNNNNKIVTLLMIILQSQSQFQSALRNGRWWIHFADSINIDSISVASVFQIKLYYLTLLGRQDIYYFLH